MFGVQSTIEKLLLGGLNQSLLPLEFIALLDQSRARNCAGVGSDVESLDLFSDNLYFLRSLEELRLSGLQVLAEQTQCDQALPRLDCIPWKRMDLRYDANCRRGYPPVSPGEKPGID